MGVDIVMDEDVVMHTGGKENYFLTPASACQKCKAVMLMETMSLTRL